MGTDKRERQKANRALKQQELEKSERRRRSVRIGVIVAGALVAVFGIVWIANVIGDDGDEPEATVPPITEPAPTTPDDDGATDDTATDDTATDDDTDDAADDTATDDDAAEDDTAAGAVGGADEAVPDGCPPVEGTDEQTQSFDEPPPFCLDPEVSYAAQVTTSEGEFTIDLDQELAPQTVNNFVFLARNRYFDGTVCHRIIPDFVVQCGDPTGTGTGGPGYQFDDELPEAGAYELGSVAMANSGPDTNGSQFFIITGEQGVGLTPDYSLFGAVGEGFDDTVRAMESRGTPSGDPSVPVEITSVTIITS